MISKRRPFRLDGIDRVDDTPAHEALREAPANCLTNTNWFEHRGVVCVWSDEVITIANPGDFRMPVEEAMKPGSSDPRNETTMKMLAMVEIGERAGSGMDKIFKGWEWAGYAAPSYDVEFGPDRTTLTLPLVSTGDSTTDSTSGRKEWSNRAVGALSTDERKTQIIAYLGKSGSSSRQEISKALGVGRTRTGELLSELVADGKVVAEGSTRNRRFSLPEG